MIYTETIILKATVVFDTEKAYKADYEEPAMRGIIQTVLPIQGVEIVRAETILRAVAKTPDALLPERPMGNEPD